MLCFPVISSVFYVKDWESWGLYDKILVLQMQEKGSLFHMV